MVGAYGLAHAERVCLPVNQVLLLSPGEASGMDWGAELAQNVASPHQVGVHFLPNAQDGSLCTWPQGGPWVDPHSQKQMEVGVEGNLPVQVPEVDVAEGRICGSSPAIKLAEQAHLWGMGAAKHNSPRLGCFLLFMPLLNNTCCHNERMLALMPVLMRSGLLYYMSV